MLGLRQQVRGDKPGIRLPVRDHHDLRGPGRQIASGARGVLRDLQLGLRHPGVARPENLVDLGDARSAVGQRRDRLGASGFEDVSDPEQARGSQDVRIDRTRPARGGVIRMRAPQPAMREGTPSITTVEGSGAVPPGT